MAHKIYLPNVHGEPRCSMNVMADIFAQTWMILLDDKSKDMFCDERLVRAAQKQAEFLADNDFQYPHPHLGENGSTANQRAEAEGYRLPWRNDSNNIESAVHGWRGPEMSAISLATHDTHIPHMMRQGWFSNHVVWGVGAAKSNLDTGEFYVVVSAPIE